MPFPKQELAHLVSSKPFLNININRISETIFVSFYLLLASSKIITPAMTSSCDSASMGRSAEEAQVANTQSSQQLRNFLPILAFLNNIPQMNLEKNISKSSPF
jgi:hypothetical protein